VVLERGARATFAEDYGSSAAGYVNTVVELVVGDGARLEYVTTQRHHPQTRQFGTHRATIGRDAEIDWVVLGFGAERQWKGSVKANVRDNLEAVLSWHGADVVDSSTG